MAVRRVVTGEVDGRSRIISDGPVAGAMFWEDIWWADPSEPLGREPDAGNEDLEGKKGMAKWRLISVPPDAELRRVIAESQGEEAAAAFDGFHKTGTLDFIYVLEGEIGLQLDDGEIVELHPGDCVVQRATNHAWRNSGNTAVRFLGVMTTLP